MKLDSDHTWSNSSVGDKTGDDGLNGSGDRKSGSRDGSPDWFDVGIIKGTTCTVASFYLPSEDGAAAGLENEPDESVLRKVDLQVSNQ